MKTTQNEEVFLLNTEYWASNGTNCLISPTLSVSANFLHIFAFCSSDISSAPTITSNNWRKSKSGIFTPSVLYDNYLMKHWISCTTVLPEKASEKQDIPLELHYWLPCLPRQNHHLCKLQKETEQPPGGWPD